MSLNIIINFRDSCMVVGGNGIFGEVRGIRDSSREAVPLRVLADAALVHGLCEVVGG